jgi:O-6-methylguanine DNA methyltransferase
MPAPATDLTLSRIDTPLAPMLLVTDGEGAVRALDFVDFEARLHRLLRRHHGPVRLTDGPPPAAAAEALAAYFAGDLKALEALPVRTGGTPFQRSVWAALRRIPAGETRTYGGLAAALDLPRAVRAVGLANGANPVAVIVPCHRVIGASGALTGYAGGVERKAWLLRHEGARMV